MCGVRAYVRVLVLVYILSELVDCLMDSVCRAYVRVLVRIYILSELVDCLMDSVWRACVCTRVSTCIHT